MINTPTIDSIIYQRYHLCKVFCKRLPYFLSLLVIFCQDLSAQFPGYYVQHFNSDNGMQNTIKGLQRDNNEFVWIATESGLVRFDGRAFTLYDHADNGTPVNRLTDIGLSRQGYVYVQASYQGYYVINEVGKLEAVSEDRLFKDKNDFKISVSSIQRLYDACKLFCRSKIAILLQKAFENVK